MSSKNLMEKSDAYIFSQRRDREEDNSAADSRQLKPVITVSHQTGAGAHQVVNRLAEIFQETEFMGGEPWLVFDRQLIERALLEQGWPKNLADKIREEKRFFIDELMDDLFSLRPPSWVLMPQVVDTAKHLAMEGHVILVGHGATIITAKMPSAFHVRLTGSLPRRIERVQKLWNLTPETAAKLVNKEDHSRERYLRAYFHARLDNELLHDLSINTDRISNSDAASMIADGARRFFSALSRSGPK